MEFLYLPFVVLRLDGVASEHILGAFNQALLPVLDLIGMNRNGPRKLDSALSEIFLRFQASNLTLA